MTSSNVFHNDEKLNNKSNIHKTPKFKLNET